ncbi:hypothetical protein ACFLSY_11400, partial [Bacteroidota bacterium]
DEGAKKSTNSALSDSKIKLAKARLAQIIVIEEDSLSGEDLELYKQIEDAINQYESFEPWLQLFSEILNTEAVLEFRITEKTKIDEFVGKIKTIEEQSYVSFFNEYTNIVQMPGLILSTNAKTIEGNSVSWNYGPLQFFLMDYEMEVKSRIINFLPFIISGLFILVIIAGILAGILRRRKM